MKLEITPIHPNDAVAHVVPTSAVTARRRTFGRRILPSRRTFGRRAPSRRTFGRRAAP